MSRQAPLSFGGQPNRQRAHEREQGNEEKELEKPRDRSLRHPLQVGVSCGFKVGKVPAMARRALLRHRVPALRRALEQPLGLRFLRIHARCAGDSHAAVAAQQGASEDDHRVEISLSDQRFELLETRQTMLQCSAR